MGDLRILHVASAIAPRYGGLSTAVLGMCAALASVPGVSVELAATDADGPRQRLPAFALAARPFRTHLFPVTGSGRWKRSRGLRNRLRAEAGRFDLLHLHGAWAYSTVAARRAARASGKPYVYSPHGMLSEHSFARSPALKWAYWRFAERANACGAATILATSAGEAEELRRIRLSPPIRIIPLGVDPEAWHSPVDSGALRRMCGPDAAGHPILLSLSRLHPKKGIADFLLPAFARLRRPAFLAIAGGPDGSAPGYPGEIDAVIDRHGLRSRVAMLGPIAPADRWRLFDGAAAFVLPSHQENFGLAVAEAMARGCPVVVSDRVQSCDHVRAAHSGLVVPLAIAAISEALRSLLDDGAARSEMGDRGRTYARAEFEWSVLAPRIVAMYRACLK